jgi:hypothetical protein
MVRGLAACSGETACDCSAVPEGAAIRVSTLLPVGARLELEQARVAAIERH